MQRPCMHWVWAHPRQLLARTGAAVDVDSAESVFVTLLLLPATTGEEAPADAPELHRIRYMWRR